MKANQPCFESFMKIAAEFDAIPVIRQVLSDGLTPVSAFHRLDDGKTACLFESVVGGEQVGRFSFLAVRPKMEIVAFGNCVSVRQSGEIVENIECENPLNEVRQRLSKVKIYHNKQMPPFAGGAVGYAGYDVIRYTELLPHPPKDDRNLPDMSFAFFDEMLVFDHINKTLCVVVLAWPKNHDSVRNAFDHAQEQIDQILDRLTGSDRQLSCGPISTMAVSQNPATTADNNGSAFDPSLNSNLDQQQFQKIVNQAIDYIRAGDIFQVVLSQRMHRPISCDPFEIYRTLRVLNPSPFMFFVRTNETTLVGSSPEIMCRVVDGVVTVRPLAGTRPRGATLEQDKQLEKQLLNDQKERAEHTMLVDLGRNDVGRVARFGTVDLPDVMVVERYSHVMHISSTVTGMLRDDCDAFDALMASLPAGTVSGAPKVRAMEIIDQLEPSRRGPYAGAVGYLDYSGNMDTCIALRTIVIKDNIAYVQAGAGIVADSDPNAEYRETLNKAGALLQAIQVTEARMSTK